MQVLQGTGWNPYISQAFDYLGGLAASTMLAFSEKTEAERIAEKKLQEEARAKLTQAQLLSQKQDVTKLSMYVEWQKIKDFLLSYWWLSLIAIIVIFGRPIMRFFNLEKKKRRPARRYRTTSTRLKSKTKSSITKSKSKKKTSNRPFKRRIGNTVYTSKKKWSDAMRRRRKR